MESLPIHYHTESIAIVDTPSRQKKTKKNCARTPRKGRGAQQEDIPWTAARCQRLLRTISSRIQILRRLSENDFAEQFLRTPKAKRKRDIPIDPVEKLESSLAALQTPSRGGDPEWFPTTEKKGNVRNYGGRRRPKKHQAESQGQHGKADVGFRTPYIRSLLRPEALVSPISPADDAYSTSNRLAQIGRRGKQDAIQPKTHAERALKTLLDSFDSLLGSTDPIAPQPRRGASSLRSMCLRRMPAYIDYEQRWAEEEEDDYVFDATETIYVQLENMGEGQESSLRELVRAHAVMLITDAMRERMWPLKSMDTLMKICARHQALIESQQLLWTWLESSKGKIEEPQKKFIGHALDTGSVGFMFRTLAELSTGQDVELSDLCSNKSVWRELPTALARRSHHANAAVFLRRIASGCYNLDCSTDVWPSHQAERTSPWLRTSFVCWSPWLFSKVSTATDQNSMADKLHRLALEVGQNSLQSSINTPHDHGGAFEVVDYFLTASLMLHAALGTFEHVEGRVGFDASMSMLQELELRNRQIHPKRQKDIPRRRATFTMDVAQFCECADVGLSSKTIVKKTAFGLLQATTNLCSTEAFSLKVLASDIATLWAESELDNDSQDFADDIQRLAVSSSPGDISQSADGNDQLNGFRWEAAIGEWVAATPFVEQPSRRDLDGSSSIDSGIGMSDTDTPSKIVRNSRQKPQQDRFAGNQSRQSPSEPADCSTPTEEPFQKPLKVDAVIPTGIRAADSTEDLSKQIQATNVLHHDNSTLSLSTIIVPIDSSMEQTKKRKARRRPKAHKSVDPDRDELSLSPRKPELATTTIAIFNDPEDSPLKIHEDNISSQVQITEPIDVNRTQERDELAMTPHVIKQPLTPVRTTADVSKVRGRRSKSRPALVTPARMTLRSHRKPRMKDKENEGERVSEDELGV